MRMKNKNNNIKTFDQHKVFLDNYWKIYKRILIENRDDNKIIEFKNSIEETNKNGGKLIFVGNGASASLSSHAATDFSKQANIKAIALNDHNLITALSNDYGYEYWVEKALKFYAEKQDRVIFISVSGKSQNLINGIDYANSIDIDTSSLTGSLENNPLKQKSKNCLWVNSKAYNIVESVHTIWITLIIDLIIGYPEYEVN